MSAKRALHKTVDPARQAEIERLIAEQAADDTLYVPQWHRSLDAPLRDDGTGSLFDTELRELDVGPIQPKLKQSYKVTAEQVREWRVLRDKEHWTYAQIAEYAGVQTKTVRRHLQRRRTRDPFNTRSKRVDQPNFKLQDRLEHFRAAYEAGASLREIAKIHHEDLGYKTWQSCYQQLRLVLKRDGVAIRPRTLKHGMRSKDVPLEVQRQYQRETQQRRRRAGLIRCDAVVRSGRPCRRWAVNGGRYCMVHDERTRQQPKWTRDDVLVALRGWAELHGRPPQSRDWMKATGGHPTFKTVTDLFGKWNFALYEAGLRERKHPKSKRPSELRAKGYKDCAQPGCSVLVAPSRHFCRDRRCQDARWKATINLGVKKAA